MSRLRRLTSQDQRMQGRHVVIVGGGEQAAQKCRLMLKTEARVVLVAPALNAELRDLVYVCDRAYSGNEIIDMEEKILKALEYQITIPSAHAFLVRYLKAAHADKKIVQLACFVLDGTLQSYNLLHYLPSQLAAAAVFIARRCVGRNSWSPTLLKYAEYCEEEVIPVARAVLAEKNSTSPELRAVSKKYTSNRYGGVANTALVCDF